MIFVRLVGFNIQSKQHAVHLPLRPDKKSEFSIMLNTSSKVKLPKSFEAFLIFLFLVSVNFCTFGRLVQMELKEFTTD